MARIRLKFNVNERNRANIEDEDSGLLYEIHKQRYTKVPPQLARKILKEEPTRYDIVFDAEDAMVEILEGKNMIVPDELKNTSSGNIKPVPIMRNVTSPFSKNVKEEDPTWQPTVQRVL